MFHSVHFICWQAFVLLFFFLHSFSSFLSLPCLLRHGWSERVWRQGSMAARRVTDRQLACQPLWLSGWPWPVPCGLWPGLMLCVSWPCGLQAWQQALRSLVEWWSQQPSWRVERLPCLPSLTAPLSALAMPFTLPLPLHVSFSLINQPGNTMVFLPRPVKPCGWGQGHGLAFLGVLCFVGRHCTIPSKWTSLPSQCYSFTWRSFSFRVSSSYVLSIVWT